MSWNIGTCYSIWYLIVFDWHLKRPKYLTLSRLGAHLVRILSLAIHISPNNGTINTIQFGKVVVNVLTIHCAL
jgi:hypothetical protein